MEFGDKNFELADLAYKTFLETMASSELPNVKNRLELTYMASIESIPEVIISEKMLS